MPRVRALLWIALFGAAWAGAIALGERLLHPPVPPRVVTPTQAPVEVSQPAPVLAPMVEGTDEPERVLVNPSGRVWPPVVLPSRAVDNATDAPSWSVCRATEWWSSIHVAFLPGPSLSRVVVACGDRADVFAIVFTGAGSIAIEPVARYRWMGLRPPFVATAERPLAVDLEGDGAPDLVLSFRQNNGNTAGGARGGQVFVVPVALDGSFGRPRVLGRAQVRAVAAADVSPSAGSELVILDAGEPWASREGHLALATGRRLRPERTPAGLNPEGLAVLDFDRDGQRDIAVVDGGFSGTPSAIRIFGLDRRGRVVSTHELDAPDVWSIAAGDLDGDGVDDLLAGGATRIAFVRGGAGGIVETLRIEGASVIGIVDAIGDSGLEALLLGPAELSALDLREGVHRRVVIPAIEDFAVSDIAIGDLDGDGDRDAVIVGEAPGNDRDVAIVLDVPSAALRIERRGPLPAVQTPIDLR